MNFNEALFAKDALDAVMNEVVDGEKRPRKMPFKLRYKLAKIEEALDKEAAVYEAERVKLVHQFGEEVEDEGVKRVAVKEESKAEFFDALMEVLNTEVDLRFDKLTEEDIAPIGDVDIDISMEQMRAFIALVMEQPL